MHAIVRILHVLIIGCITMHVATAQPLWSGRVNTYAAVTSIDTCRNALKLSTTAGLHSGDRVVIMQMQGAVVDTSASSASGTIIDPGMAGAWEINTIDSVMGTSVRLRERLLHPYVAKQTVQLIRMATSSGNAVVRGPLLGQAWNGTTGGVIAIACADTLTISAMISARGLGFRGGGASVNTLDTAVTDPATRDNAGLGGRKGEGCALPMKTRNAGRGSWANGGGGGNARNGGGGGGANAGQGGKGGGQPASMDPIAVHGEGGWPLAPNDGQRIVMGGGGGGGHQNDFKGSAGASGGGIIIILAGVIVADSAALIDVRGNDAGDALEDGAGGGGGGGTIVVVASRVSGGLRCIADGGRGGANNGVGDCYAPGGGGGGGVIRSTVAVTSTSVSAGDAGSSAEPLCDADVHHGALSGVAGAVVIGADVQHSDVLYIVPAIVTPDTTVCARATVTVQAQGGVSYTWTVNDGAVASNAAQIDVVPMRKRSVIVCAILTKDGCVFRDTMRIDTTSCADPTSDVGFRIDDVGGLPGDSVSIPIHVATRDSIRYATALQCALLTRASVLVPDPTFGDSTSIKGNWRRTWFTLQTRPGLEDSVIMVPMQLALGDDDRSMITIDTFICEDPRVIPRIGRFGICSLDVCIEGGRRLFDHDADAVIRRRGTIVSVEARERVLVTIDGFDTIGRTVSNLHSSMTPWSADIRDLCEREHLDWLVVRAADKHLVLRCGELSP